MVFLAKENLFMEKMVCRITKKILKWKKGNTEYEKKREKIKIVPFLEKRQNLYSTEF